MRTRTTEDVGVCRMVGIRGLGLGPVLPNVAEGATQASSHLRTSLSELSQDFARNDSRLVRRIDLIRLIAGHHL